MSELEPSVRELLEAASGADDPTPEERKANRVHLDRRFALLGVTASALAHGTSGSATALSVSGAAGSSIAKVVLAWVSLGAVAGTVVGGAVIAAHPTEPPRAVPAMSRPLGPSAVAAAPARSKWPPGTDRPASIAPSSNIPTATLPQAATSPNHEPTRMHDALGPPSAQPAATGDGLAADSAATQRYPGRTAPDLSLALGVLARAQKQLTGGRPDQALSTLDEFARSTPDAPMGEEREALRIVALCHLEPGRGTAEAEQFLLYAGGSPLAARVRAACGL